MAYNKYLLSLITILSILLFINFGFSLDISGCMDLNEDYLGQTLTLTQPLAINDRSCFIINFADPNAGDNNSITIDCQNNSVDYNNALSTIFIDVNSDLDTFNLLNCDINNTLSNVISKVLFSNNFIQNISFLDSNFYIDNILDLNNEQGNIDINFYGSNFSFYSYYNLINVVGDANSLNIYDLNISSTVLPKYIVNWTGDLNYLNIFNSYFDMIYRGFVVFNNLNSNISISMQDTTFVVTDSYKNGDLISFSDSNILDLNLSNINYYSNYQYDIELLYLDNSDVERIFLNAITGKVECLIQQYYSDIVDNNIFFSNDFNMEMQYLIHISDTNLDYLNITGYNDNNQISGYFIDILNSDINTISLYDSSFDFNGTSNFIYLFNSSIYNLLFNNAQISIFNTSFLETYLAINNTIYISDLNIFHYDDFAPVFNTTTILDFNNVELTTTTLNYSIIEYRGSEDINLNIDGLEILSCLDSVFHIQPLNGDINNIYIQNLDYNGNCNLLTITGYDSGQVNNLYVLDSNIDSNTKNILRFFSLENLNVYFSNNVFNTTNYLIMDYSSNLNIFDLNLSNTNFIDYDNIAGISNTLNISDSNFFMSDNYFLTTDTQNNVEINATNFIIDNLNLYNISIVDSNIDFITVSGNSDINKLSLLSTLSQESLSYLTSASFLDYNIYDTNFYVLINDVTGTLIFNDLNILNSDNNYIFYSLNSDINVELNNSNIVSNYGTLFENYHGALQLSSNNSDINVANIAFNFIGYNVDLILDSFEIYAEELISILGLDRSTHIGDLEITDSNITTNILLDLNVSDLNYISINNNVFYDLNTDNNFIVLNGIDYNIDFNSVQTQDLAKRTILLTDDSNEIGGNLWLDENGINLCSNEIISPFGICDDTYLVSGTTNYDYYPLIYFDSSIYPDLTISNIVFTGSLTTLDAKAIDCNIGNISDNNAEQDYNVLLYANNVLVDYNNISSNLDFNSYSLVRFSWTPGSAGTYNLGCVVDYYSYDQNSDNNSYSESFTITSDGGSDGDSKTYNVKLTSNYSGSLSSSTNTTITSNITKSGTKSAESLTYKIYALKGSEKILVYSKNISASEVTNGQTIDKEIKASDLSGNLLDYISNDKISFVIEIDSDDDVSKDNTETLNIPTNYFEVILNANIDSKLTSDINAKIIGKVSKLGNLNDVILNLYLISENNKKLIDQKTIESYPYDYNYFLNINTITENLDYIDSQGYINLKLELESNDTNAENNSKNLRSKVEFFDFDIENILLNDNNYELNDTFEFNILETYNLVYVLNYSSINKLGFAEIRFINDSKNRQINSQKFTFGKLDGKDFNKILYEFKINLLTLMSEQDARLLIKSVMNLDNSEDSQKTINSIITNLGNNLNLKHDENKSYFLSNVDNITIDLIGSDLEKINSNLIFEYVYNFVDTPSPKKDENKSSSSKENVKELPTDNDYVLKYKQKIGINELQEIYIFDTKDNKLSNINVLIDSNNFSWYLASDFNGLVIFDPNFSGIYNISLPYPNIKIKAEFEVIDNYISLNDEFVEITSQSSYSVMKNKIFNIFIFVAIIIILIVGIILYFVFKPRKISSIYDFSKSNYYNDYNLRTEIKKEQLEKDIKFAYNEEKILEKKLKDKIGYDL